MGKVLHASDSGYFPGCIKESADNKYAIWTLEKAMQTYWRVRAWDFRAVVTIQPYEDSAFSITSSIANIRSNSSDEAGLVCGQDLLNPGEALKNADLFFGPLSYGNQSFQKVGDLYYSGLEGNIYDYSHPVVDLDFDFGTDVFRTYGNDFPFSILGSNLRISVGSFMEDQPDFYDPVADCEASLTPSEWWSYGGTYNTSTGARL